MTALSSTELALESLEPGRRHDLRLHLADDGLGFPVHVPVIVARGSKPGPVFGIVAALHGNELNGIWVIHALMGKLEPQRVRGSVVAVVVANPPGLVRRQRGYSDGYDLNRVFPGSARGKPSSVWAHRLRKQVVSRFDRLVDLHTAGAGRVNSVYARVDLDDAESSEMARLLHPQLIVHKPATDGSLRGWASSHGIPAVTLEIGDPQRRQGDFVTESVRGLRRVLRATGVLPGSPSAPQQPTVTECRKSKWTYATRGGLLHVLPDVGTRVEEGNVLGRLYDAFGNEVERYVCPKDAWVVGKTADPICQTGGRIVHLAFE